MNNMRMRKKIFLAGLASLGFIGSCGKDFLERTPLGSVSEVTLQTENGANALLIGAYSALDGWTGDDVSTAWFGSATNWVYGSIAGGDAHKGSDAGDQPDITPIERFAALPTNPYFNGKWRNVYDGISRCNDALRAIKGAKDIADDKRKVLEGEARFIRGHLHFEAKKMWNNVPFVSETTTDFNIPNDKNIWPDIEADFKFAADNLPVAQQQVGRATKGAAQAYLGKTYLFQGKFTEAKAQFEAVINSGRYRLADCFGDNFNAATKNGPESVFSVQFSVNDGTEGQNGNFADILNYPYTGGPGTCCGFFQPSQNLVNAFQTENGLPLLDTYNNSEVKSDQGVESNAPFTPHAGPLDPRLDWSVGRRGIPYLDWGKHPGKDWIRDQTYSGPYAPMKHVYRQSQSRTLSTASGWAQGANANNYILIRYADVMLMAAECEVEGGNLEKARDYVNQIRRRAAKSNCFVKDGNRDAANYQIREYTAAWTDKATAQKAVRFERRLELALEGHRFFDLVRWGIADQEINTYLAKEATRAVNPRNYLNGARFIKGKHEYYPIPQDEIVISTVGGKPTLKQNPGY
jgi:hypothetical protein